MPTIVGILTFMSRINLALSWVELKKSFITSGPDRSCNSLLCLLMEIWLDTILYWWTWQVILCSMNKRESYLYIIIHSGRSLAWVFMKEILHRVFTEYFVGSLSIYKWSHFLWSAEITLFYLKYLNARVVTRGSYFTLLRVREYN